MCTETGRNANNKFVKLDNKQSVDINIKTHNSY